MRGKSKSILALSDTMKDIGQQRSETKTEIVGFIAGHVGVAYIQHGSTVVLKPTGFDLR